MSPFLPLTINDDGIRLIADLLNRASKKRISYQNMLSLQESARRGEPIQLLNSDMTIYLPDAYAVTLTEEEHKPGKWYRHVSISVRGARPNHGPSIPAVNMIIEHFGYPAISGKPDSLVLWTEPMPDRSFAINILMPLNK